MTAPFAPNLTLLPHPFSTDGVEQEYATILPNDTLRSFLRRNEILPAEGAPFLVSVNGEFIRPELWKKRRLRVGDRIEMRRVAQGSAGLRIIGAIIIAIAAVYTGGAAAAAYGGYGTAAGAMAGAAASAAVSIAGGMLMNAVLPATAESASKYSSDTASTTYSLSGANNSARYYEPLPLIFGSHKIKPDLASKPYTEIIGGDMYLAQAFNFGLQPDLEISEIQIGDTSIGNYQGVQVEISGPDGKLGLIAGNVDTDTGRDIVAADGWVQRTTSPGTTRIVADMAIQAYRVDDNSAYQNQSIELEMQYAVKDSGNWQPFVVGTKTLFREHYWSLGFDVPEPTSDGGSGGGDYSDGDGWSGSSDSYSGTNQDAGISDGPSDGGMTA